MAKLIAKAVLLIAGTFLMIGGAIGVSIILVYAVALVLVRRLKWGPQAALTAGS